MDNSESEKTTQKHIDHNLSVPNEFTSDKHIHDEPQEVNKEYSIEDIKFIYEFKYNAVKETALMLTKGVSFYLAILAGLFTYIFTSEVDDNVINGAIFIGIVVSIFAIISSVVLGFGIITGLFSIKDALKLNNEDLYNELNVSNFFYRGILAVVIILLTLIIFLIILIVSMKII